MHSHSEGGSTVVQALIWNALAGSVKLERTSRPAAGSTAVFFLVLSIVLVLILVLVLRCRVRFRCRFSFGSVYRQVAMATCRY